LPFTRPNGTRAKKRAGRLNPPIPVLDENWAGRVELLVFPKGQALKWGEKNQQLGCESGVRYAQTDKAGASKWWVGPQGGETIYGLVGASFLQRRFVSFVKIWFLTGSSFATPTNLSRGLHLVVGGRNNAGGPWGQLGAKRPKKGHIQSSVSCVVLPTKQIKR